MQDWASIVSNHQDMQEETDEQSKVDCWCWLCLTRFCRFWPFHHLARNITSWDRDNDKNGQICLTAAKRCLCISFDIFLFCYNLQVKTYKICLSQNYIHFYNCFEGHGDNYSVRESKNWTFTHFPNSKSCSYLTKLVLMIWD